MIPVMLVTALVTDNHENENAQIVLSLPASIDGLARVRLHKEGQYATACEIRLAVDAFHSER
jgi:hypothetical protein